MTVRASNILLTAMIPVMLLVCYAVETIMPDVTITRIGSSALNSFFAGQLVAHITDQHMVGFGLRERLTVSLLEKAKPDIIFMTGDYVEPDTDFDDLERYLEKIKNIAPVIASPGNNDYCCIDRVKSVFGRLGIPFLMNETVVLESGDDSLYVVGLEDNFLWLDDYFAATEVLVDGNKRIVLGHAPAIAEKIDARDVELVLTGHLHGGQVVLPIYGPISPNDVCFVSRMYNAGLYDINGMNVYSNRGLGTSSVPLRFMSRPEIALFEFTE